ncbi:helix-turn-helix domain-containing protein [Streptomyces sp. NPDC020412]|uniref:helix-turn-helix domain-containing protein n=1 Tax=Streptomyces sp. NPDC020412 TaxID=3365073 RepID=UPI0037A416A9
MYQERRSAAVDGAVLWTREQTADAPARPVLPDGCMDLLWTPGRLFVAGPDTRAYAPGEGGPRRHAGVRFAPGTAPAVLKVPAHELLDRRVDLADLWGARAARRLTERIDAAPDPAAALEDVVLARAADAPFDPLLREVARLLDDGASVAAAAGAVGLGARQLHRRALVGFGYGPKTLARVLRLQRALALVWRGAPYAGAALAAGYADQAHFAREVRALAGMTLGDYCASAKSETPAPSGSSTTA